MTMAARPLSYWLKAGPLVAILRGIRPEEAVPVGAALFDAGFRLLEVPMNSPDPLDRIARLADRFGDSALIRAGTVVEAAVVLRVAMAGVQMIVLPYAGPEVEGKEQVGLGRAGGRD